MEEYIFAMCVTTMRNNIALSPKNTTIYDLAMTGKKTRAHDIKEISHYSDLTWTVVQLGNTWKRFNNICIKTNSRVSAAWYKVTSEK